MKTRTVVLLVVGILLAGGAWFGYQLYKEYTGVTGTAASLTECPAPPAHLAQWKGFPTKGPVEWHEVTAPRYRFYAYGTVTPAVLAPWQQQHFISWTDPASGLSNAGAINTAENARSRHGTLAGFPAEAEYNRYFTHKGDPIGHAVLRGDGVISEISVNLTTGEFQVVMYAEESD